MEVLSFDVCGKLAHFKKFYANNTALTYSIPPRTTIMGMLAAVAGYERDSYYERLVTERLRIGIRVLHPLKKTFHRLNFLSIKSRGNALDGTGDFTGAGGRIQTPFEVVSGLNLGRDTVAYRVFLAAGTDDQGEFARLKEVLAAVKKPVTPFPVRYNLTLGTANFSAWMEHITLHPTVESLSSNEMIKIHSAVPSDKVVRLDFKKDDAEEGYNYLEEELMPADFAGNQNRELSKLIRVLFSTQGKPFDVILNCPYYVVKDENGHPQNILFLE